MNKNEFLDYLKSKGAFKGNNISSGISIFIKNRPELFQNLKDLTFDSNNVSQLIWHLINGNEIPCCPVCGKELEFKNYGEGYKKACSKECSDYLRGAGTRGKKLSEETKAKIKETNLKKFGVDNPFKSKEIREKIKQTNLEKYGVEAASQNVEVKKKTAQTNLAKYGTIAPLQNSEIKAKMEKTNLERYGSKSSMGNLEVRKKARQTNLERYGVESYFSNKEAIKEIQEVKKKKFYESLINGERLKEVTPLFSYEEYNKSYDLYKFKCDKCGNEFYDSLNGGHVPLCPICYPKNEAVSEEESEIRKFLSENYKGIIERNNREIIHPYELDIYLPELKLAIEYDGLYWHSMEFKDPLYHLRKTEECKEKGIRLVHITSDEWHKKRKIVKSFLLGLIGIYDKKIGARECIVKEIEKQEASLFLEDNHFQGSSVDSIRLGLYFGDELVSVLTFAKPRFNKKYDWEIIRFSNKRGYEVFGGFSKLLSYFSEHYKGSIITYSDKSKFTGDVYRKNNFEELESTPPNYFYFRGDDRIPRQNVQKNALIKKFPDYSNLTESEIMKKLGYYRFYDCGNWKFVKL